MNFEMMRSSPPQTPYAPIWDYSLGVSLCKDINLSKLSKTCLQKEREILKLPYYTDGYTGLGKRSTTSRFVYYNVLEWKTEETQRLKSNIARGLIEYNNHFKNDTPSIWVRCWVNILRWGQYIKPHLHQSNSKCYLSGHFNVQCGDTSTVYMNPIDHQVSDSEHLKRKNVLGELTIFPSYVYHYTTKHYSFKPRITIAFDLYQHYIDSSTILL